MPNRSTREGLRGRLHAQERYRRHLLGRRASYGTHLPLGYLNLASANGVPARSRHQSRPAGPSADPETAAEYRRGLDLATAIADNFGDAAGIAEMLLQSHTG